jgi:hypothetical protein
MFAFATGCANKGTGAPQETVVTGKVYYKGKPLPGGRLTFVAGEGGSFSSSAVIGEDGSYTMKAPVGPVSIAVDNTMLRPSFTDKKRPQLKPPGAPEPTKMKGRYVDIPRKYFSTELSGLKYIVTQGEQTHDIKLGE